MTGSPAEPTWRLRLYVNGTQPRSLAAIDNIRAICDHGLTGTVDLVILDIRNEPALLVADQVIATPTLVKLRPPPVRHLVGDLSDTARVRAGLGLPSRPA